MATDTTTTTPTRRTMLASIAVLPAIGIAGQLPAATADPEWTRLVAEWREAHAEAQAAAVPFNEAEKRYQAARLALPEPQPPAVPKLWNLDGTADRDALHSVIKGTYQQEHAAYRQRCKAHQEQCDAVYRDIVGEAGRKWDAALNRSGDAAQRVLEHPITTAQQLVEKFDMLATEFDDFGRDLTERQALIEEIRRIAGRA